MNLVLRIPDDLAERLSAAGDVERQALEALAADAYRAGRLTKPELCRMLGLGRIELDGFLKAHEVYEPYALADFERERQVLESVSDAASVTQARQAAANIIARRKGVTLGGLTIRALINEGRP
jgi:hypothetical protein